MTLDRRLLTGTSLAEPHAKAFLDLLDDTVDPPHAHLQDDGSPNAVTLAQSTDVPWTTDTELGDNKASAGGTAWALVSGALRPPIAGRYLVSASLDLEASAAGEFIVKLLVGGTEVAEATAIVRLDPLTDPMAVSLSRVVTIAQQATLDAIGLAFRQDFAASETVTPHNVSVAIVRVGDA